MSRQAGVSAATLANVPAPGSRGTRLPVAQCPWPLRADTFSVLGAGGEEGLGSANSSGNDCLARPDVKDICIESAQPAVPWGGSRQAEISLHQGLPHEATIVRVTSHLSFPFVLL